jgi:hypothetical protein
MHPTDLTAHNMPPDQVNNRGDDANSGGGGDSNEAGASLGHCWVNILIENFSVARGAI